MLDSSLITKTSTAGKTAVKKRRKSLCHTEGSAQRHSSPHLSFEKDMPAMVQLHHISGVLQPGWLPLCPAIPLPRRGQQRAMHSSVPHICKPGKKDMLFQQKCIWLIPVA